MERRDCSHREIELVVAAYFRMLERQVCGEQFSKARENELVRGRLDRRTRGSVDFKLANVSAVLVNRGLVPLAGYKPRPHYQRALEKAIEEFLADHPIVRRHLEEVSRESTTSAPGKGTDA